MKQQYLFTHVVGICFALLALAILPSALLAQDEEPVFIHQRIVSVVPDKLTYFEALMKERTVAEEAAGIAFRHVFQRLRGPLGTFLIVGPGDGSNIPDVDLPPTWGPAIAATLDSHTLLTSRLYGSTREIDDTPVLPTEFLYVRLRTVVAGRNSDYEDWQMNTLIPALRKAGDTHVRVARVVLGGNPRTWARYAFVDAFPTSTPPNPDNTVGELVEDVQSMVASGENYFFRFRDDLSFSAPAD